MCRFIAYRGPPTCLEALVCAPPRSLLRQAQHAEEAKVRIHGDGVGIGWYSERDTPDRYRAAVPAWSDVNLVSLCRALRSHAFFAHVRAATGTPTARANCHPFAHGRWLFMHNGQVAGYATLRRDLEARLPDALGALRRGATDSELLFLLLMARIEAGEEVVAAAVQVLHTVSAGMHEAGVTGPLRFAAALTDGRTLYAFRTASDARPPSLYLGTHAGGTVIVSEPLDEASPWHAVPEDHAVVVDDGGVALHALPAWSAAPLPA
jgi:predicted glutamine amidotransferase